MEYLAFTFATENFSELLLTLINYIDYCECNTIQISTNYYGTELIGNFLITGHWNAIAKFENYLNHVEKEFNLQIFRQRTKVRTSPAQHLPYLVSIIAKDQPGILLEIYKFFLDIGVIVESINAETYNTKNKIAMCSLILNIKIPDTLLIGDLRERFTLLCDSYNLDGILEPEKN